VLSVGSPLPRPAVGAVALVVQAAALRRFIPASLVSRLRAVQPTASTLWFPLDSFQIFIDANLTKTYQAFACSIPVHMRINLNLTCFYVQKL